MDVLETRAALEVAAVRRMTSRMDDLTALLAALGDLVTQQRELPRPVTSPHLPAWTWVFTQP